MLLRTTKTLLKVKDQRKEHSKTAHVSNL